MTDYHFVSSWRLQAPIERVWEEVVHTERWPSWWKYVHRVDQLDPGDADGLGRRQHLVFTTRLPYRLGFDIQVHRIQPPKPRRTPQSMRWATHPQRYTARARGASVIDHLVIGPGGVLVIDTKQYRGAAPSGPR